ncbi:MAG TPA: PTS sugar transporter subunit IIA [Longimicrobiales bacterium]|nr:PTS sugar transporter subunit IIA [Longimicrobiales bacterium]
MVLLSDLLSPDQVKVPLVATEKDDVLRELVDTLVAARCADDADEVLAAVRERESVLSTGIGNGIAIPHAKSNACDRLTLVAGSTREPIEFEALDGEPVQLLFLLVGPERAAGDHIKALGEVSRLVRKPELRQRLVDARDSQEFLQVLREASAA